MVLVSINVEVGTIHSYAGLEYNNVMILMFNNTNDTRIHLDGKYMYTAMTRAKENLIYLDCSMTGCFDFDDCFTRS